jgi:WD40 repeat protein
MLDGRTIIASGSADRTVYLWEAAGTPIGDPFTGHTDEVNAVVMGMVDGRTIVASGSDDGTVRAWEAATGTPIGDPFTGHTDEVNAVAVEIDGRSFIASAGEDQTLRIWPIGADSRAPYQPRRHSSWPESITFSAPLRSVALAQPGTVVVASTLGVACIRLP